MKVILLQDVAKVGRRHEVKELADGYARNFIIARGLGIVADKKNLAKLQAMKTQAHSEAAVQEELLAKVLAKLKAAKPIIKAKANPEGHLFAQIHAAQITELLAKTERVNLKPEQIIIPKPIKTVGEHQLKIKTPSGEGEFRLVVEAF